MMFALLGDGRGDDRGVPRQHAHVLPARLSGDGPSVRREPPYGADQVDVPTLLVYGGKDIRAGPAVAHDLESAIPGCTLVVLPDAGHLCNIERPDEFNNAVRTFLRGTGSWPLAIGCVFAHRSTARASDVRPSYYNTALPAFQGRSDIADDVGKVRLSTVDPRSILDGVTTAYSRPWMGPTAWRLSAVRAGPVDFAGDRSGPYEIRGGRRG